MDIWIPQMGGEKAVGLIKNTYPPNHVPVLLFSANIDIEAIAIKVKADGFVTKPFEVEELITIVQTFVG